MKNGNAILLALIGAGVVYFGWRYGKQLLPRNLGPTPPALPSPNAFTEAPLMYGDTGEETYSAGI